MEGSSSYIYNHTPPPLDQKQSHMDHVHLLINYVPITPTPRQQTQYAKILANQTPATIRAVSLYIHNHIKPSQVIFDPPLTPGECKITASTIRKLESDTAFANHLITTVYLPQRIGATLAPMYRKLIEFIQNPDKYDINNPSLWVYHHGLGYYILKPNVLYSYQLPTTGPVFWICKNGRDKYYSLLEVVSMIRCTECRKGHNISIDPIMFNGAQVVVRPGWAYVMNGTS